MSNRLLELPWLPGAPTDFRARCKDVESRTGSPVSDLRFLASHQLDINQLTRLARCVETVRVQRRELAPLRPFRLGLLSNATTELLVPALVASALRHGVALTVVAAPFDQAVQAAADPDSVVNKAQPDAVLLALDHRGLGLGGLIGDAGAAENALALVDVVRDGIRAGAGAPLIVQTVPLPPDTLFGSLDAQVPESRQFAIAKFNHHLAQHCTRTGDVLFDVATLAGHVGSEVWHDAGAWYSAKLSFDLRVVPLYSDALGRLLGAMRGTARKCLVLDLDNTVWGGVIGDDGLNGIRIGQGSPEGEAFLAIQQTALALRQRGVVLAVCSKNDDAVARQPFLNHPDMVLEEGHIAIFQANWTDKAANLRAIAEALNIGLDGLVFFDDNPAERAIVRRELPEVAVPELPSDPALYPRILLNAGYFEAVAFSDDDRRRAEQYQANAQRAHLLKSSTDLEGYLASLDMTIHFAPFDQAGRKRIAQLINKSNQFNLTTQRYSEAQVAELTDDSRIVTLQFRLRDSFGDNGMVGVVICRKTETTVWCIDTWLMSCRVLGRRVENAVLNEIVRLALAAGISEIHARYIPSGRNELVRDHYAKLGFKAAGHDAESTLWALRPADFQPFDVPISVERSAP